MREPGYVSDLRERVGSLPLILVGSSVIPVRGEELLLQLRRDTGEWGLIGGFMEPGETFLQTALRELEEETGLKRETATFLEVYSGPDFFSRYPNGDQVHNVMAIFVVAVGDDPVRPCVESLQLAFHRWDQLPAPICNVDRPGLNRFVKLQLADGLSPLK